MVRVSRRGVFLEQIFVVGRSSSVAEQGIFFRAGGTTVGLGVGIVRGDCYIRRDENVDWERRTELRSVAAGVTEAHDELELVGDLDESADFDVLGHL